MEMNDTDGAMMAHGMTDALFDVNDATHVAVSSGAWTDPSTWKGGRIPTEDAKVHIPMGIEVEYDSTSDVRLEVVRVDGALDFATNQDTYMLVESLYTGTMSRLTIGTADNPVDADVKAQMIFADGEIDLALDPEQVGHGLVAEGKVEIHGHEKSPYTALDGNAMAGSSTLTLDGGTEGWAVGDTIVVMGTELGKFQDEYRTITSISETGNGVVVKLDSPLDYNHTSPEGHDLDIYVGNSTRNVFLTSENPEGVRGHVMMMHTPDVSVQFAEFSELGRTDKSRLLNDTDNVASRYPLHLHETGTSADSEMAVLYGNSVHGSPGWGIVQHSSNAAIDFNFVHDIDGAGIVSEDGDELGQWIGNFVTGVPGTGSKFSIQRDEHDADFGHSGVAYENQARQIIQQDNIAANANTGWMFRAAETSVDNPDRDALQFDPAPLKDVINNEEPAIVGFHDNQAIAVNTVLDTGHRQDMATTTDLRSDMDGMIAWEVNRVFDIFSYTGEYVISNGLFIGADGAGRAVKMPQKHESTSIVNSHFENFNTAISDTGLNHDGVYMGLTFKNVNNKIEAYLYGDERLQNASEINLMDRPKLTIDSSSDLTMGKGDGKIYISGTIVDSAGTLQLGSNRWTTTTHSDYDGIDTTTNDMGQPEPEELLAHHGAMRDGDGWIMPITLWITDRVTGEHHAYRIDINVTGYSDAFMEQFEISEFSLPSNEIVVLDSYAMTHSGDGGSGQPDTPVDEPDVPVDEPDVPVDEPDVPVDEPDVPVDEPDVPVEEPDVPVDEPDTGSGDTPDTPTPPTSGGGDSNVGDLVNWALSIGTSGADIPSVELSDDFTIAAWVKLAEGKNISVADAIVGSNDFDVNFKNGHLTVSHGNTDIAVSKVAAQDGVWAHYAVVREGGTVRIYQDGDVVGESKEDWTDTVFIDKLGDGQLMSRGLVGDLDEVRIWDGAHSEEQVNDVLAGVLPVGSDKDPVAVYDFEDQQDLGNGTEIVESEIKAANDTTTPPDTTPDSVMELGRVESKQLSSSDWIKVKFSQEIPDAVVVMGPVSNNGGQESFARVRNVTDEGFEYQIEEWDYLDGKHTTEEISWMAMSEGTHTLADGRTVSATRVQTDNAGEALVELAGSDVVLAQVGSDANAEAVVVRTDIQDDGTIALELQRQEDSRGGFDAETVYVIRMDEGQSDHFEFSSGVQDKLDHNLGTIDFDADYDDVAFLGSISTVNGGDTVALRLDDLDGGSASVFLQEEKSLNDEVEHLFESVSWIAGEVGVYDLT
ncbi:LamG-like jellyroll fold domain-containing protein [Loktanella sp. S4079]|uniref:LamG-like jellyroll fold domain-containing protein n=1 Tax=Loktanella sp. S4079 TaxID=579483 RepID=UPI0005FA316A|nr:LamG-like jellyroll fold domain-containing protein [Loktanella sp. S4079]KJZ18503.1 hypothetical protein TW80_13790 [Loktanella sp. S4079]